MQQTRRTVLAAFLSSSALPALGARMAGAQAGPRLEPTPACGDDDDATPAQTEGPFFEPGAPSRHDLAADAPEGEPVTIAGFVLDRECRPMPGALVQIWHADERGRYDNSGYRLRGHQPADDRGRWWFSTIVPAAYPGRTRHYHFKVAKPGGRVLTTQLYFPGEPLNRRDRIFDERLLLRMEDTPDGRFGRFDFVV